VKIEGQQFKNSDTCEGTVFAGENIPQDIATIKITGRYPENGWAINEIVHELALVSEGSGSLEFKGADSHELKVGDVISVEPGKRFAWNGEMTIVMTCSPAFSPNQYKLEDENEV
jgi:mannose-6-phosphate isomerase-like protein (cupin superfamily)